MYQAENLVAQLAERRREDFNIQYKVIYRSPVRFGLGRFYTSQCIGLIFQYITEVVGFKSQVEPFFLTLRFI